MNVVYKERNKIMRQRRQKGSGNKVGMWNLNAILNTCHIRYFCWWIKADYSWLENK